MENHKQEGKAATAKQLRCILRGCDFEPHVETISHETHVNVPSFGPGFRVLKARLARVGEGGGVKPEKRDNLIQVSSAKVQVAPFGRLTLRNSATCQE